MTGHLARDWWHVEYAKRLRTAVFCGAFPGDGWSGGISSAVLAGCVPVIVMDGIDLPFENVLHYPAFSVRIAEADLPQLPRILRAIPPGRVQVQPTGRAMVVDIRLDRWIGCTQVGSPRATGHAARALEPRRGTVPAQRCVYCVVSSVCFLNQILKRKTPSHLDHSFCHRHSRACRRGNRALRYNVNYIMIQRDS